MSSTPPARVAHLLYYCGIRSITSTAAAKKKTKTICKSALYKNNHKHTNKNNEKTSTAVTYQTKCVAYAKQFGYNTNAFW